MKKLAYYSFLVGTGALLLSIAMILIAVPLLGDTFQKTMFVNSVIGCYGIGTPVTYYCLRQSEKLRRANEELDIIRRELQQTNLALVEQIRIDSMTGLLSRDFFFSEMKERRRRSRDNSVLLIDADHFKKINDRWGHLAGDEALKAITDAIRAAIRKGDVVGRIGGEEFAVFLPGADHAASLEVAERIRKSVAALAYRPAATEQPHQLTVSIGGTVGIGDAEPSQIMTRADKNLYRAKNAGRNCVVLGDQEAMAA